MQAALAQPGGRIQLQNMWQHLSPPARGGDTAGLCKAGGTRGDTFPICHCPRRLGMEVPSQPEPLESRKSVMNDTPGLAAGLGRAARGAVPVTESLWQGGIMGSSPADGRDTGWCPGGAASLLSRPKATGKAPHSPGAHPRQPEHGTRMGLDEIQGIWEWALQHYPGK